MIENFLHEHFKNDTKKMSLFISDFIGKELLKKELKTAFDELDKVLKYIGEAHKN